MVHRPISHIRLPAWARSCLTPNNQRRGGLHLAECMLARCSGPRVPGCLACCLGSIAGWIGDWAIHRREPDHRRKPGWGCCDRVPKDKVPPSCSTHSGRSGYVLQPTHRNRKAGHLSKAPDHRCAGAIWASDRSFRIGDWPKADSYPDYPGRGKLLLAWRCRSLWRSQCFPRGGSVPAVPHRPECSSRSGCE